MTSPDSLHASRPPHFTKAAWWVLLGGLVLTCIVYQVAVYYRRPGEWLPGVGQAAVGILVTALGCFTCGLVALLRRERRCWLALLPFLAGLGVLLHTGWNMATR